MTTAATSPTTIIQPVRALALTGVRISSRVTRSDTLRRNSRASQCSALRRLMVDSGWVTARSSSRLGWSVGTGSLLLLGCHATVSAVGASRPRRTGRRRTGRRRTGRRRTAGGAGTARAAGDERAGAGEEAPAPRQVHGGQDRRQPEALGPA